MRVGNNRAKGMCARLRCATLTPLILCLMTFFISAAAKADSLKMQQVKSAVAYNIAKFVEWPEWVYEQRPKQLQLCFYQTNPWSSAINTVAGKFVKQRKLVYRIVKNDAIRGCDMLVVSESWLKEFYQHYKTAELKGIMTIADLGERRHLPENSVGIVLAIIRKGKGIGFEIDRDRARAHQLNISSELLKLATIVTPGGD